MAIDMRRLALAAVEAALDTQQQEDAPKQKKHRLGAGKALLLGAGLMTAGRVAMRARESGLLESLQERLAALEGDQVPDAEDLEGEEDLEDEEDEEPEDLEDEEPEDLEDEEGEEPEDYEDEEPEDYEDEEPDDLEQEDEEEERRPSRARSGTATKRGRRGSRDGHGHDDTA